MNDIEHLYQEIIIDHSSSPKNFGRLENKTHCALGNNPLCGDVIAVDLLVDQEKIVDIKFSGEGCAISKASSSLMTQSVKGKNVFEAKEFFKNFQKLLTEDDFHGEDLEGFEKLSVLEGVKQFPMRVKCATLAWHTLNAALLNRKEEVTTE